jgi:hypothetical protein
MKMGLTTFFLIILFEFIDIFLIKVSEIGKKYNRIKMVFCEKQKNLKNKKICKKLALMQNIIKMLPFAIKTKNKIIYKNTNQLFIYFNTCNMLKFRKCILLDGN